MAFRLTTFTNTLTGISTVTITCEKDLKPLILKVMGMLFDIEMLTSDIKDDDLETEIIIESRNQDKIAFLEEALLSYWTNRIS